jgi:hypothetical protein
MSDDGHEPNDPNEDGFVPIPAKEFWDLAHGLEGSPVEPEPETDPALTHTTAAAMSLEERLAVAQAQGLGPNLRRQLAFVGASEAVFEFQALGVRRYPNDSFDKSRAAHARSPEDAVALCADADGWIAHGIYLLPARLRPGVETRHVAPGRWYDVPKGGGTTDSDVEARLVLAVDFDVKRSSAISATEEEMQRSVRVAQSAWSYLAHHLGESSLAYLHSGNGRQIHVALDAIPATDDARRAVSGLLTGLAHLFNTPEVAVDEKLSDAKRILPACGTVKKKGAPGVDERPHRRTAIVTPEAPTRVPLEGILRLARTIWESATPEGRAAIDKAFGVKLQPPPPSVVSAIQPKPESPFAQANEVDPQLVAEWLGLYNARGEVVCPGCSETEGVSVINHGLKCFHNRCKEKGRDGFRTNVDLVMEVHRLTASKDAVIAISDRFGLNLVVGAPTHQQASAPQADATSPPAPQQDELDKWAPTIGERLSTSVARAVRRWVGIETPVPLPWEELKEHFGGGLWPGVHVLCSGTGVGKTAAVLQICKHSAEKGVPTAYVGLEMDDLQFDLRVVGEEAKLRWSDLYTGQTNNEALTRAATVALELIDKARTGKLPLHPVNRNPMGWPASNLNALAAALRQKYPEPAPTENPTSGGPGSRPILIVLDYLQIIGPEEDEDGRYKTLDLRERIGRAAYALREVATDHNIAILVVASVARANYGLWPMVLNADLRWDYDKDRLVNRRVTVPDNLVGLGKESGEIEYGADSVSVLARVPDTYVDGQGESVVFVTAKGRATGARWTPMHFTGFRYEAATDGGDAVVEALSKADRSKEQKRAQKEEEKKQAEAEVEQRRAASADAKEQQRTRDRDACLRVVTQYPGIGARQLRSSMAAVLGECGKDRADAAISYCESVSHTISVQKRNARDIRYYPGHTAPDRESGSGDEMREVGSEKSPIPPSVAASSATRGAEGEETSATPATPQSSTRNYSSERVAEGSATPPKHPATSATPTQLTQDEQIEADSAVLFDLDESKWRDTIRGLGWSEPRSGRARTLARHLQSKARADALDLRRVRDRGEDPRAWATERGWPDDQIRNAMRFIKG